MWDLIVSVPDHCLSFYFGYSYLHSIDPNLVIVPYCCLFLLFVFILWFSYYVSDIFCKF